MKTLAKLLAGELKRMVSYKILPVSLATSLIWIALFFFLNWAEAVQIAPLLIFVDAGMMSVLLIGAAHHLERQEGTVKSIMVMPVAVSQVLSAKVIASMVLGLQSTVVTCAALYFIRGITVNYGLLVLFVALSCAAHGAIGFSLAISSRDFSSMLALLVVYILLFATPSILFEMKVIPASYEWLVMLSPSYAAQYLITGAVTGKLAVGKALLTCGYLAVVSLLLYTFHVSPGFKRHAVRGEGMRKYLFLLKFEWKTILRDPVNLFMCIFPLILLGLSAYVFPNLIRSMDSLQAALLQSVMLLMVIMILTLATFLVAALATFLLLEHKDEHTLHTIAATPLGLSGYLTFKMGYIYILSVFSGLLVLFGTKLLAGDQYILFGTRLFDKIGPLHIIAFSLVNGLFAPALALFQSAFAKNKVEGFAWIKGTGMVALAPLLLALPTFQSGLQYVLGIFPNFWAAKGMMLALYPLTSAADLPFWAYLLIGAAYNLLILTVAYRFFLKKQQY